MRRLDRLLGLIIGLALAVAAVLTGIEVMELVLGNPPAIIPRHTWDRQLRLQHWNSSGMEVTSGVLLGVGVVLILLQLVRRRPVRLALRSLPGQRTWLTRQGLARRLAHDVGRVDNVRSAKVKVGRRRVRARVVLAAGTDRSTGSRAVRQASLATLGALGVVRDMNVKVKASAAKAPVPVERIA